MIVLAEPKNFFMSRNGGNKTPTQMTGYNALTGTIPTEIGNMSAHVNLDFCEWAFINRVKKDSHPVRLSYTFLLHLDDSSRMTGSNALTGTIPTEIGNMLALVDLDLGEWAFVNCVQTDSHPMRLSHTFLVLLDS
jgi:hypothetical protein